MIVGMKCFMVILVTAIFFFHSAAFAIDAAGNHRKPAGDAELKSWLENMIWHHRFTDAEVRAATGLTDDELAAAKKKHDIRDDNRPRFERKPGDPLRVLPYPGGRHPRTGFLDGAIDPQRETKISVFAPWDQGGVGKDACYVVIDVPEAVWSNLGLTYLAHTHVPTIWSKQRIEMEKLEWTHVPKRDKFPAHFTHTRKLPNGIAFTATITPDDPKAADSPVTPSPAHPLTPSSAPPVRMELSLTNGTKETLTDLRVQMCAMLKGAPGFDQPTNDNKLLRKPYTAVHDAK